jgi:hypothetical protein
LLGNQSDFKSSFLLLQHGGLNPLVAWSAFSALPSVRASSLPSNDSLFGACAEE